MAEWPADIIAMEDVVGDLASQLRKAKGELVVAQASLAPFQPGDEGRTSWPRYNSGAAKKRCRVICVRPSWSPLVFEYEVQLRRADGAWGTATPRTTRIVPIEEGS